MNEQDIEDIYLTLTDQLIPEAAVPGVENAFKEGLPCRILLDELGQAHWRLLERFGQQDEDQDLEIILSNYERIQQLLCLQMFRLGWKWANNV